MCAACASSSPDASNSAQEKSRRSLMFAEKATRCSTNPISSAAASKRLRISSSSMGSVGGGDDIVCAPSRCWTVELPCSTGGHMTVKERLARELENAPEPVLEELLDFVRFLKSKSDVAGQDLAVLSESSLS